MCDHHLMDDPSGLVCTRTDVHDPHARGGHVYRPASGYDDEAPEDQ